MHGSSVVLISLFTSVLTAAGATYVMQRYQVFPAPQTVREVAAPALVGLSEGDARANAQALQLPLLVEGREAARGVAPGTVLRQSIAAGHPVPDTAGIGVVFAANLPIVPKVTELSVAEAKQLLAKKGFKGEQGDAVPDARIAPGHVVRQAPEADAELEAGGIVVLMVSSGPTEVEAPKLTGMALRTATDKLGESGLVIKVRWISKAETVTGVVLSQKPNAGDKLAPKSTVEVVVNR